MIRNPVALFEEQSVAENVGVILLSKIIALHQGHFVVVTVFRELMGLAADISGMD